jgi:hypothetical protein
MRALISGLRVILVIILTGAMPIGTTWGAAHEPPKSDTAKISNAMSAAPPAVVSHG